jgi:hypothetical protein
VAGACDEQHIEVLRLDRPVEMDIDKIEPWRGAPMAEQARLDVFDLQRLAEQRIVEEIDLSDRQIVRRPPPGMHQLRLLGG